MPRLRHVATAEHNPSLSAALRLRAQGNKLNFPGGAGQHGLCVFAHAFGWIGKFSQVGSALSVSLLDRLSDSARSTWGLSRDPAPPRPSFAMSIRYRKTENIALPRKNREDDDIGANSPHAPVTCTKQTTALKPPKPCTRNTITCPVGFPSSHLIARSGMYSSVPTSTGRRPSSSFGRVSVILQ
jgi:hypothetical protein